MSGLKSVGAGLTALLLTAVMLAGCSTFGDGGDIAANAQPQAAPITDSSVSSSSLPPIGGTDGNVQQANTDPNATGALKIVGEAYPFGPGSVFALTADNHNSVNGIREFARHRGAVVRYVPIVAPDLRAQPDALARILASAPDAPHKLFAYPAQSNFSGVQHPLDWIADDQPFPLIAGTSPFVSVPYSIEINDIPAFVDQALTPRQFTEVAIDHFEVLHEESHRRPGAVYALSLHPFLVGQPFRHRHLLDILEAISGHEDVWYANSDEIADWYITNHLSAAEAAIDQYERKWKR